jgi:hypothetical protein
MKRFVRGCFKVCASLFTNAILFWSAVAYAAPNNDVLQISIVTIIISVIAAIAFETYLEQ